MIYKKAAMFGLDARIALAIFGTLSVISGAALYSAIQEAKVVSLVAKMNEISKAMESYLLDTGLDIPVDTNSVLDTSELITSTKTGWKGPYLSYNLGTAYNTPYEGLLDESVHSYLIRKISNEWVGQVAVVACTAGKVCSYWINARKVPKDLAAAYDLKVDGVSNVNAGSVRVRDLTDVNYKSVYLKIFPLINQP